MLFCRDFSFYWAHFNNIILISEKVKYMGMLHESIYANIKRCRTADLLNRINFAMFKTFAVYFMARKK